MSRDRTPWAWVVWEVDRVLVFCPIVVEQGDHCYVCFFFCFVVLLCSWKSTKLSPRKAYLTRFLVSELFVISFLCELFCSFKSTYPGSACSVCTETNTLSQTYLSLRVAPHKLSKPVSHRYLTGISQDSISLLESSFRVASRTEEPLFVRYGSILAAALKDTGFSPVLVINRVSTLAGWNRVWFLPSSLDMGMF